MTANTHPNYLQVRQDWLDRCPEQALEPDLPIFDAHHHLWDRAGWRYLFDELRADIIGSGHRIVGTAFMQCQSMYRADGPPPLRPVGETEFANGVAAMAASGRYGETRVCASIIGHADLRLGEAVRQVLHAHIAAGGGRFRGIRYITTWDADSSLLNPLSAGHRACFRTRFFVPDSRPLRLLDCYSRRGCSIRNFRSWPT